MLKSPIMIPENPNSANDDLRMTESAALKIFSLMQEEGNLSLKLRIYVQGGGCSGFQYGFSFEEVPEEGDCSVEFPVAEDGKVTVLIDYMSLPYLKGAEIDYRKDLQGEQFIVRNNPNAKTTCGCGSSFTAE
ncbi:MAG: iron-sulfur cluster insertion protein ErpA [Gammaproteobacteria bacterium]